MDLSNRRLVSFARRHRLTAGLVNVIGRSRARKLLKRLRPWLPAHGAIVDVGTGSAHLAEAVRELGHRVVGCDITDMRFVPASLVYADGSQLPFVDESVDATLILTVLHHVPKNAHEAFVREGVRVLKPGGRLLILEDSYHSILERWFTLTVDTLMNAEFSGHPHANRTLKEWKELLARLGLRPIYDEEFFVWYGILRIRHALIVIERD